jgi:Flp pilus assembly protein TadG
MKRLFDLRDERGTAAIEFVIAVPVLVMMIWGIFQVGVLFEANAGVEQALGEGARLATIYDPATHARPTNDAISNKIVSAKFGVSSGGWQTPTIDDSTEADDGYITISVEYDVTPDFLFFHGPAVVISKSKRVYTQVA